MILVDTSVIVRYWRSPSAAWQKAFTQTRYAICAVTRAELCHGANSEANLEAINSALDDFEAVLIDDATWAEFGRLLFTLRKRGVSVSFQDGLIASVALQHNLELWTLDTDFKRIQEALPQLKLFTLEA